MQTSTSSPDAFSGEAFDVIGQPGGLVLGSPTAGAGLSLSWLAFPAHVRRVRLRAAAAHWILALYLAVALFGLFRIVRAWRMARRLVRDSRELALSDRERAALADCSRRLGVALPQVRESSEIAGPVVVGVVEPLMLWPEDFAQHSEDEVMAALCHEMAHIRRRDYLVNLLCEAAALPLNWHPAIYGVERCIRRTREMVCDAMAAEAMQSEIAYAKCLVALAQSVVGRSGLAERARVPGLFSGNVLEERVMRLMQGKTAMSVRAKVARGVLGATAMVAAIALTGMFHVVPAMAQTEAAAKPAAVQAAPVVSQAHPAVSGQTSGKESEASPTVVGQDAQIAPGKGTYHVPDEKTPDKKPFTVVNGDVRALTPEEQRMLEEQLANAQGKIAEATAKINSPEFRKQIEDARRKAMRADTLLNSPEFKQHMADVQRQAADATAKLNSAEFKQKVMEDVQRQAIAEINSAAFQKQIEDAQRQMEEATAKLNSPEFRQQIEDAQRQAAEAAVKIDSAEFQKQMADAQKQIADALAKMKAEQGTVKVR